MLPLASKVNREIFVPSGTVPAGPETVMPTASVPVIVPDTLTVAPMAMLETDVAVLSEPPPVVVALVVLENTTALLSQLVI